MVKVGDFYIATVKTAWERDRWAVREKMGIGPGEWRRIASANSHFQAKRIMRALTEQAKRDPLNGMDLEVELEAQMGGKIMNAALAELNKQYDVELKKRAAEKIAAGFAAGQQVISGISDPDQDRTIKLRRGGASKLTITIE